MNYVLSSIIAARSLSVSFFKSILQILKYTSNKKLSIFNLYKNIFKTVLILTSLPIISLAESNEKDNFEFVNKLYSIYTRECQNGVPNLSSPWLNVSIDECLVALKLKFSDSEWRKIENYSEQFIGKNFSESQLKFYENLFNNKSLNHISVAEVADTLNYQYSNASVGMSILILPIYALTVSVIIYFAGSEDRENEKKYKEKAELDNFSSLIKQCENDRNLSIPDNSPNKEASKIANAKLCLDQVKLEFDLKFFKSINN